MFKDLAREQNEFLSAIETKTNIDNIETLFGNLYWQRKAAEAIAAKKIAEAELECFKANVSQECDFVLSNNAKQALNNQTMYLYLQALDKILAEVPDGYVAKQVFSGDDR